MFNLQHPEPTPWGLEDPRTNGINGAQTSIMNLFRVPERYLRSIQIERDFEDTKALKQYVMTPPMVALFSRVIEGLRPESGERAWRVTGDYGTGKSSFALVLSHLLCDSTSKLVEPIRQAIEQESGSGLLDSIHMFPVLVTGAREPLVPAVGRALTRSLERSSGQGGKSGVVGDLIAQASEVITSAEPSQLLGLLSLVRSYTAKQGYSGVFLVLDELGKFLEYAALRPDKEDLYILQHLAEAAARSGDCPLIVLSLLHQGFHAYAESLPSTIRQEWEKVAGRYGEITFDQPLGHVTALVTGALNIDQTLIPKEVTESFHSVRAATLETGWYGTSTRTPPALELYPLHPTMLPVLVRFFARFGQHERSLFSFLLSSEPFGLQSFAERPANGHTWYRLSDFYDYIRSMFGHQLARASYRGHWLRITETIDRIADVSPLQLRVLKTVAVLNVLDAEHLLADKAVLAAALADGGDTGVVGEAVTSLQCRGLLFNRGVAGGYCLWPSTSVDLASRFEVAKRSLGPASNVYAQLTPYLDQNSVVARRHYIEGGTLRHFEIRYADFATMLDTIERPAEADGMILVVLCDSLEERRAILSKVSATISAAHPEVIVAVPPPLRVVAAELLDAQCWQWVADNTPELNQDSYAADEVARQTAESRRVLLRTLESLLGIRGGSPSDVEWWYAGKLVDLPVKGKLSAMLSNICDELYHDAPYIRNELLNRRTLSSAAAAARLRLIDHMFSAAGEPSLGMDQGKAPPEKSMYLSVLRAGNVHREEDGHLVFSEPPEGTDKLHLRPALMQILALLERANGRRVPVSDIFDVLKSRPYGVRMGVAPLLLAITVVAHGHEIAVYENGTYLQRFSSSDFLRLIKQSSAFELQLCRVAGVRMEVFRLLARIFAEGHPNDRDYELLDVVRPLSIFAAQLPECTRRDSSLPDPAKSVCDALLTAREPATLIFETLPVACGLDLFPLDGYANPGQEQRFVETLQDALADLQDAYPQLLESIRDKVVVGLGGGGAPLDRAQTTVRASRILLVAREPRLQTFARALSDTALSDDSWANESVAPSFPNHQHVGRSRIGPERWTKSTC